MATTFRPYDPDQGLLLPPSLRDWLPEDHLAYFISDTVDQLDLSRFYEEYQGDGRRNRPYEPRMMLKVLIYGYATGTFSSRKIARKLHEDVAFRMLVAGNFPAHRTLADFRHDHLADFESLFVQVVRIAREVGLVKLGTVAIDGSKVKANASKHKAMSYERMEREEARLKKDIRSLVRQARKTDAREDRRYGKQSSGEELPAELARRSERLEKIQAAKRRLEERQVAKDRESGRRPGDDEDRDKPGRPYRRRFGEVPRKAQENFTDPDSRIMKTSKGFEQCYNAQAAVDAAGHLIVATGLTNNASDSGQLTLMVDEVARVTGELPERALADAGYCSEANLRELEEREVDAYVALGREGKAAARKAPTKERPATARMRRKLASKRGRARYRRRKCVGEPPFGWIKSVLGFRGFSLRGQAKVRGEWNLVCLALNLRRMGTMMAWI